MIGHTELPHKFVQDVLMVSHIVHCAGTVGVEFDELHSERKRSKSKSSYLDSGDH